MKSNEIEFLCEVVQQITEEKFGETTYIEQKNGDFIYSDDAQDFFNERYDEIETLFINLIKDGHDNNI